MYLPDFLTFFSRFSHEKNLRNLLIFLILTIPIGSEKMRNWGEKGPMNEPSMV